MPHPARTLLPYLFALAAPSVLAAADMPLDLTGPGILSDTLQASLHLPGSGVQMLQLPDRLVFVSANGRYAFSAPAWDLWHGQRLVSVAQARDLAARVDLERLGLDPADLGAIRHGGEASDGEAPDGEALWVFLDPLCPVCHDLLDALAQTETPANLIALPLGGAESADAVRRLRCAPSPEAAHEALFNRSWRELPAPSAACEDQSVIRALITARLLGVDSVPTLIAPDGRIHRGMPQDLAAWLAGEGA